MTKQKIKVDPIRAMLLKQNAEALKAYDKYFQMGGDFRKYIDAAEPELRDSYISVKPRTYAEYKEYVAFDLGLALKKLTGVATLIKTAECRLPYEYWDSWRFCAQAVPDHPDRPAREKFCEDYRANEPPEKCIHYYKVGDEVCSLSLAKGYYLGKVIGFDNYDQMRIEMIPNDRRRKKKVFVVRTDCLDVFPWTGEWRKEKPSGR